MTAASLLIYQGSRQTHELEFHPFAMCIAGRDLNCTIKKAVEVWNKASRISNYFPAGRLA